MWVWDIANQLFSVEATSLCINFHLCGILQNWTGFRWISVSWPDLFRNCIPWSQAQLSTMENCSGSSASRCVCVCLSICLWERELQCTLLSGKLYLRVESNCSDNCVYMVGQWVLCQCCLFWTEFWCVALSVCLAFPWRIFPLKNQRSDLQRCGGTLAHFPELKHLEW